MITSALTRGSQAIQVAPSHIWTVFRLTGTVCADDIVRTINEEFPKMETADVIWDFSEAVFPAIEDSDLRDIMAAAKSQSARRRDARTVFVCKGAQLCAALSRYMGLASKDATQTVDYVLVDTLDEAERWLTCNRNHRCGSGDCEPGYASCPRGNCRSIRMLQAYRRFWGKDVAPLL